MLGSVPRSCAARLLTAAAGALVLSMVSNADATVISYGTWMTGPNESPPNASPGTGFATLVFDDVAHTMHVHAEFSGLLGSTTASHVHAATTVPGAGTAGVATMLPSFAGFPLGVTSGVFDNTFNTLDAATWNPAFITAHGGTPAGAEAFFFTSLNEGRGYYNIHSTQFSGGEIRGFMQVPSPGTAGLLGLGGLLAFRRRRA